MDFSQRAADAATNEINGVLGPLLDTAIVTKRELDYKATRGSGKGTVAFKRIGAGYIGVVCDRDLGFRFHKYPKETREGGTSPGELQRHAEAGHWTEHKTAEWLKLIGIRIATFQTNEDGEPVLDDFGKPKQIGWMSARDLKTGQYQMAGEVDGVIVGVDFFGDGRLPDLIKVPCIWESKKGTDKKWKKFDKDGVKGADPVYYGQLQINMGMLGIPTTLFSMLNLDTMRYHFELVPYDGERAQTLSDRAAKTMETEHPYQLTRAGKTEDDWVCRFCDYKHQCWHPTDNKTAATQGPFPLQGGWNPNDMDEVPF